MRTFIVYSLLIFLTTSCQSPQTRTPVKTTSGSFIEASVARNKRIYEEGKAIIQALIKKTACENTSQQKVDFGIP